MGERREEVRGCRWERVQESVDGREERRRVEVHGRGRTEKGVIGEGRREGEGRGGTAIQKRHLKSEWAEWATHPNADLGSALHS